MAVRVMTTAVFLALGVGLGCDRAASGSPSLPDSATVRAGVDSAMRSHFSAFERGDMAAWSEILAPDVFFTAANPAQVFAGRDSVRENMQRDLGPTLAAGVKLAIQPLSNLIWVAENGRTAAATYDLDYTVRYDDQVIPYRLRSAYLLERDTSGWRVLAAQYSRPVTYDTLFMSLVSHQVPGVAPVGGQVPSAAGEVVRQFRTDIRDISKAYIAPMAAVITPGMIVQGAEPARRELAAWLGPIGNATEPGDGIRGGVNQSGTVGWVATNLHVPVFAGPETAIAPMRALFVYHLAGDRWEIVQASLSVGLRDRL
jgi:ketosteroid isomerase-like protein